MNVVESGRKRSDGRMAGLGWKGQAIPLGAPKGDAIRCPAGLAPDGEPGR